MVRLSVSSPRLASLVKIIPITFISVSSYFRPESDHIAGLQHGLDHSALGSDAAFSFLTLGEGAAYDGVLADLGVLAQNGVADDGTGFDDDTGHDHGILHQRVHADGAAGREDGVL